MKTKLIALLLLVSITSFAEKVKYKLHSEIVTNWISESSSGPVFGYSFAQPYHFNSDIQSSGADTGIVKSNHYAAITLAGKSNAIVIDSQELFVIRKPWKDVKKVERVYETPSLFTNSACIFITNNMYLGSICVTNLIAGPIVLTNYLK